MLSRMEFKLSVVWPSDTVSDVREHDGVFNPYLCSEVLLANRFPCFQLLTTYPVLSPRADRTFPRRKTTLALSPRYRQTHTPTSALILTMSVLDCFHLITPFVPAGEWDQHSGAWADTHQPFTQQRHDLAHRDPDPGQRGLVKRQPCPSRNPSLEQDSMANCPCLH